MAVATRAAGDEEGNGEGGESDGDGNKEGDGEEEGEGPHSLSSSDRLPPCHMLPLLLRLATAFRAVVGAALRHSFGVSSASTTTTRLGSTVEASSSASSAASPATSKTMNVVEHPFHGGRSRVRHRLHYLMQ